MNAILRCQINAQNLKEAEERALPLIRHFFDIPDGPLPEGRMEIDYQAQPLTTPDAVVRSFIVDVTVVVD